jgi:hypothetical protein
VTSGSVKREIAGRIRMREKIVPINDLEVGSGKCLRRGKCAYLKVTTCQ